MITRLLMITLLSLFTFFAGHLPAPPKQPAVSNFRTSLFKNRNSPHRISISTPPCIEMYNLIIKYSAKYNVPEDYMFGVAYVESGYKGPFDWSYKSQNIVSSANALGPMQIMPANAKLLYPDTNISLKDLQNNLELNVEASAKLLQRNHEAYKDWAISIGAYNTGTPVINTYATTVLGFTRKKYWK